MYFFVQDRQETTRCEQCSVGTFSWKSGESRCTGCNATVVRSLHVLSCLGTGAVAECGDASTTASMPNCRCAIGYFGLPSSTKVSGNHAQESRHKNYCNNCPFGAICCSCPLLELTSLDGNVRLALWNLKTFEKNFKLFGYPCADCSFGSPEPIAASGFISSMFGETGTAEAAGAGGPPSFVKCNNVAACPGGSTPTCSKGVDSMSIDIGLNASS